jgi:hypothetical protein
MSTAAIDIARNNERLSAFLSEIIESTPVDNYFPRIPLLERLMQNKTMQNGGRQVIFPIDSGENSTVKDFSDYDIFDTTAQDTALTVVYPFVNKGGSLVISWEELREVAGNNHAIFDLVKHKRDNLMKTMSDKLAADLFEATQNALKITSLEVLIDSTGSVGGVDQSTDADWAAKEVGSGSFATQGLKDMRSLYNQIQEDNADVDTIVMNRTIYEFYENEIDPDVRYAVAQGTGGRGFKTLEFKGNPIILEKKSTSGTIYMMDSKNVFFRCDTEGDMTLDEFQTPVNQKVSVAKCNFRGNLICNRRKSTGKLTGVVA